MPAPVPRSPLSVGFDWASRIGTIALLFVLPALAGHYLDKRLGTSPAVLLIGMVVGFAVGIRRMLRVASEAGRPGRD